MTQLMKKVLCCKSLWLLWFAIEATKPSIRWPQLTNIRSTPFHSFIPWIPLSTGSIWYSISGAKSVKGAQGFNRKRQANSVCLKQRRVFQHLENSLIINSLQKGYHTISSMWRHSSALNVPCSFKSWPKSSFAGVYEIGWHKNQPAQAR